MKSLLAVVLLFSFTAAFSQDKPVHKPAEVTKGVAGQETRTSSNDLGANTNDLSISPRLPSKDKQLPAADNPEHNQRPCAKEGWWTQLLTDPIASFTGLLFLATVGLWLATRNLVRGADRTAKHQLRAYVTVPRITIRNESHPNGVAEIFIDATIRNFGQTPARRCSYWLDICSSKLPLTSALARPETAKDSGIGVIAPGDTFTVTAKLRLLPNGGEIHSGNYAMFVHGQFSYTDAFDERQTTNFRFMRSGEGWTSDGEMEVCVEGNDAE